MDSKRCIATLTGHCGKVFAAKFLPQESNLRVVSGSSDRTIRLFDLNSQTTLKTYMVSSAVQDLSVMDNGLFVSGHFDKTVRIHDSRTHREITRKKLNGKPTSILTTTDGDIYVTSMCNSIYQFNLKSSKEIESKFNTDNLQIGELYRACLGPENRFIACPSASKQIIYFDTLTRESCGSLSTVDVPVCVAWDKDTNTMFAGQKNKNFSVFK